MCCVNCESQHNSHLEINKKRLSGSFFFFVSYLLCSANTSTHDKEGFNQQWSSPTVSLDSKTGPVTSDVFPSGIWCLWMLRRNLESEQINVVFEAKEHENNHQIKIISIINMSCNYYL